MLVVIRGGGDLSSGVTIRLHRAGLRVVITELQQPQVVRRLVSFAEAVYRGETHVEEVSARLVKDDRDLARALDSKVIPVIIDPDGAIIGRQHPEVVIDGRMLKRPPEYGMDIARLVIGLGPGFTAGVNCHAAIETNRGHFLGRVLWQGSPQEDTGIPENVLNHRSERVIRAPRAGQMEAFTEICDHVEPEQLVARVDGEPVYAQFGGVLRGMIHTGTWVEKGQKIGDVDPRDKPEFCRLVSEKSLAIGGGVLEAVLRQEDLRPLLWG